MRKIIGDICRELGIELWGITKYKDLAEEKLNWLKEREALNYHTEFEENDLNKRLSKEEVLLGADSIIVIALPYNTGSYSLDAYPRGKLSKSSFGEDYHKVLANRLDSLKDELLKKIDFNYKIYVDTGPLIDRELAYQAGIGYYGKNCSIINERYGSYIFIGYMVTNLKLKEDRPLENKCGSCKLCIDACPTSALYNPYRINAKKCLSYLSQSKDIDESFIDKMGIKVYGCDTCQDVCPKNTWAEISSENRFIPTNTNGYIDIVELLELSNKEFKEKYGQMSGSWRGKNILKRNSLIALGNIGDENFIELVEKQLENESKLISEIAKKTILKLKGEM